MFGLGFIEIGIVLLLGYFAFKHLIARRYPNAHRAIHIIMILTAVLMLVFGLVTHYA